MTSSHSTLALHSLQIVLVRQIMITMIKRVAKTPIMNSTVPCDKYDSNTGTAIRIRNASAVIHHCNGDDFVFFSDVRFIHFSPYNVTLSGPTKEVRTRVVVVSPVL